MMSRIPSGLPVVEAANGLGLPVTVSSRGHPVTLAADGKGLPVVFVPSRGFPVALSPSLDLKFIDGIFDSRITFSRPDATTCATYRDSTGTRQLAAANIPRFDHDVNGNPLGLLIERQNTNFLLNSLTPATQTTASLSTGTYTLSCEGSGSVAVAGNTATITGGGSATQGSPLTFVVTVSGTVDATVTGSLTAFQIENFNDATTVIATAGATATKTYDSATISPAAFGFNPAGGTVIAEATVRAPTDSTNAQSLFQIDDGTSNNRININRNTTLSGGMRFTMSQGGIVVYRADSGVVAKNTTIKAALAYAPGGSVSVLNGAVVANAVDTGFSTLALTAMFLGAGSATSNFLNGHLRRVRYWPTPLPASVLQALTQ